jgi:hypothetical protein
MDKCASIKELLVLASEHALGVEKQSQVDSHLAACASCREEANSIRTVQGWLRDPELFAPKQDYTWQCLPQTLAARALRTRAFRPWLPISLRSLAWSLNLAAVAFLAFGLVWMMQRRERPADLKVPVAAPDNQAFLNKIQSAYARQATTQYLSDCQDLLVNLMRAEPTCQDKSYDVSIEISRARELLEAKRLLDAELQLPEVVSAKNLCDELERFLVNLSASDRCESPDRLRHLERFIQKEKLLLRINVLQSELS